MNARDRLRAFQEWRDRHPLLGSGLSLDEWWSQRVELGLFLHTNASLQQTHFRLRNDDGDETSTGATWLELEDTNGSMNVDQNYRVRFTVYDTAGGVLNNANFQLQYNLAGAGWNPVNATSSVVRSSASPNVTDGISTTTQLTAPSGSFITPNSGFDEADGVAGQNNDIDFVDGTTDYVEVEYCFQIRSADVTNGQTIQLRLIEAPSTVFNSGYPATPTITVVEAAQPTFDLDTFRWRNDDGGEVAPPTGATWRELANTWGILPEDTTIRLRALIQNTSANVVSKQFKLQFRRWGVDAPPTGGAAWGAWTDVGGQAATTLIRMSASGNVVDGDTTTQQLGAGTFTAGKIVETDSTSDAISVAANAETEVEWCIQVNSDATNYHERYSYEFRVVESDNTVFNTYTNTPTANVLLDIFNDLDVGLPDATTLTDPTLVGKGNSTKLDFLTGASGSFDVDTALRAHGGNSVVLNGVSGTSLRMRWDDVGQRQQLFMRGYFYIASLPTNAQALMNIQDEAGTTQTRVILQPSGVLQMDDETSTISTTATVSTGQWIRIEHMADTAGNSEMRLFNSPESATPTETETLATAALTDLDQIDFLSANFNEAFVINVDEVAIANDDWIGPKDVVQDYGLPAWIKGWNRGIRNTSATTITVQKPDNTAENDLLYLVVMHETAIGTFISETPPSGFTDIGTVPLDTGAGTAMLYKKTAGASEPTEYTVTVDPSNQMTAILVTVDGSNYAEDTFTVQTPNDGDANASDDVTLTGISTSATALLAFAFDDPTSVSFPYYSNSSGMTKLDETTNVYLGADVALFFENISGLTQTTETFDWPIADAGATWGVFMVTFVPGASPVTLTHTTDAFLQTTETRTHTTDAFLQAPPKLVGLGYLELEAANDEYARTTDKAALDILGDLEIIACVEEANGFVPGIVEQTILAKRDTLSEFDQAYRFYMYNSAAGDYVPALGWGNGGGDEKADADITGVITGNHIWLRATLDVDNGASGSTVTFYYSNDPIRTAVGSVSWTQLGTAQTTAGVTSIPNTTSSVVLGLYDFDGTPSAQFDGKMYGVWLYDGIGGTLVANPDFRDGDQGWASPPGIDDNSNSWTLNNGAAWVGVFTHTTDAILKKTETRTHTSDAVLVNRLTQTHSTDAVLVSVETRTHTADAYLVDRLTAVHTSDALLQATEVRTHSTDAFLQATKTRTHTTDAVLELINTLIHTTDAFLKATVALTHSTDAFLAAASITRTHTTDAIAALVSTEAEVQLGAGADPSDDTNHALKFQAFKSSATPVATLFWELRQGATPIKTGTQILTTTETIYDIPLSVGEASAITNYNDLRFRVYVEETGDTAFRSRVSWVRFEYPFAEIAGATQTHTTDAVLKKTDSKTHTTDAVLQATETLTHTTDAVLEVVIMVAHTTDAVLAATVTLTHTTDALLQATVTTDHTTDALLVATVTQTHSTDAVLVDRLTVTHTTDTVAVDRLTVTHTADAVLVVRQTQTHTTDAVLQATVLRTHTTDALLEKAGVQTHSTDALLQATVTVEHTADSLLVDRLTRTHTTDAVLYVTVAITHSTDAVTVDRLTQTHTADAFLEAPVQTQTHTTDTVLVDRTTTTHTTDAIAAAAGLEVHTTDAILQATVARVHTTDAVLVDRLTATHTTDAILQITLSEAHTADALIVARNTATHTADALLQATELRTHTTNAFLEAVGTVVHNTDAVLLGTLTQTHSTDAVLQAELTVTHTSDAVLAVQASITHSTDALLYATVEQTHSTDAVLQVTLDVSHSTDALLERVVSRTHSTDAILQIVAQVNHSTDAVLLGTQTRTHTADALLAAGIVRQHFSDAFLYFDITYSPTGSVTSRVPADVISRIPADIVSRE